MCCNGSFWPPKFLKLISRKFWVVGNFCFHIVYNLQSEISVKSHYGVFFFCKSSVKVVCGSWKHLFFSLKMHVISCLQAYYSKFLAKCTFLFFAQRTSGGYFYQIVCFAKEIYKKQFFNLLRVHDDFNKMVLICQKSTYLVFTIKVDYLNR